MDRTDFQQALVHLQAEYLELPGLSLTLWQAARLCGVSKDLVRAALGALVATGFLVQTVDGAYLRRGTRPTDVAALDAATWMLRPPQVIA